MEEDNAEKRPMEFELYEILDKVKIRGLPGGFLILLCGVLCIRVYMLAEEIIPWTFSVEQWVLNNTNVSAFGPPIKHLMLLSFFTETLSAAVTNIVDVFARV